MGNGEGRGGSVWRKVVFQATEIIAVLINFLCRDLTYNNIAEIKSQVFFGLRSLKDLRLTHSNIQRLSNMSFVTLDSLEEL